MRAWSLGQDNLLEEGMATRSSVLAWRIPWTEEPGGLHSMGSQRVRHDWCDLACTLRVSTNLPPHSIALPHLQRCPSLPPWILLQPHGRVIWLACLPSSLQTLRFHLSPWPGGLTTCSLPKSCWCRLSAVVSTMVVFVLVGFSNFHPLTADWGVLRGSGYKHSLSCLTRCFIIPS